MFGRWKELDHSVARFEQAVRYPLDRCRELLVQVQKEMVAEDRFKSLIVYYDVDPM